MAGKILREIVIIVNNPNRNTKLNIKLHLSNFCNSFNNQKKLQQSIEKLFSIAKNFCLTHFSPVSHFYTP